MYYPIKALLIAFEAHKDQVDKGNQLYIFHPIRVATNVEGELEKTVALLHDVVEDSSITLEDLAKDFPQEVIEAIDLLTFKGGDYDSYISNIKANPIARTVKLADLKDNLDITRLSSLSQEDIPRLNKYKKAYEALK